MSQITLTEQSTPSTPSSATAAFYPKSDGFFYGLDDAGTETRLGGLIAATQAEQEAASSTSVATTPGRQQYHPSAAKGWAQCTFAGTASSSYNVSSITDGGAGNVTVNWNTDFSSANYCVVATPVFTPNGASSGTFTVQIANTIAAGTTNVFTILMLTFGGVDADLVMVAAFGDH